jgi:ubiquinone/menaquinone biosynthesis C-methylase UbiE
MIDKNYYDQSNYYEKNLKLLGNFSSRFQQYRVEKVFQIYTPKKDEIVVDLGCGWGTFCFAAAPLCREVIGVDFSQKSIVLCQDYLSKFKLDNVRFIVAPAQDTKLSANFCDLIICADLIEHLYPEDFLQVIIECRRLLKPGGKLIIWTPHRGHILEILKNHNIILKKDLSHVDYKSMNYLKEKLEENNFSLKKKYYVESHLTGLKYFEKALSRFIPLLRRRIAILAEKR